MIINIMITMVTGELHTCTIPKISFFRGQNIFVYKTAYENYSAANLLDVNISYSHLY